MTIEQINKIDAIGISNKSGDLILTISDHLEWNKSDRDHLLLLQEKLNRYLAFVESGEISEYYADTKNKNIVIKVIGKYSLNEEAERFFFKAQSIVKEAGILLEYELFED